MKDPCPASYSFLGRDPRAFFFFSRGDFENQPTDKSVAQVTHSLPLAQMGMKQIKLLFDWFRAQRSQIQSRQGGLTFPDAESSYSNLAMLMEHEKFSDDMDPQEMSENFQLLRGRTLFCPAWWTKSSLLFELFLPHTFAPLSPKRKEESSKGTET